MQCRSLRRQLGRQAVSTLHMVHSSGDLRSCDPHRRPQPQSGTLGQCVGACKPWQYRRATLQHCPRRSFPPWRARSCVRFNSNPAHLVAGLASAALDRRCWFWLSSRSCGRQHLPLPHQRARASPSLEPSVVGLCPTVSIHKRGSLPCASQFASLVALTSHCLTTVPAVFGRVLALGNKAWFTQRSARAEMTRGCG